MKRSAALVALALGGCLAPRFIAPPFEPRPEPAPGDVLSVLFLVGDAGAAHHDEAPLLHALRDDVETWSQALEGDSAVAVLFLGDNIYPAGLRLEPPEDFALDSAHLQAQVWTVSGPLARARGTRGVFLAGNHDWGNATGPEGLDRLRAQEAFLERRAAEGVAVSLRPRAGTPGPVAVWMPGGVRVLAVDTHWWLQADDARRRAAMVARMESLLRDDGAAATLIAAHHPWASGGEHGNPFTTSFDPFWLLRRTGALVQDLNSRPYRDLRARLGEVFERTGAPLVFAAGHDHSLQVLRGMSERDPVWSLVSGAGSKRSGVSGARGLTWASDLPGYMRLMFLRNGSVELFVEAAPARFMRCEGLPQARAACVAAGAAAFGTYYSVRLGAARDP